MTEEQGNILLLKLQEIFDYIKSDTLEVVANTGIFKIFSTATFGELLISILLLIMISVFIIKWIWEVNTNW